MYTTRVRLYEKLQLFDYYLLINIVKWETLL